MSCCLSLLRFIKMIHLHKKEHMLHHIVCPFLRQCHVLLTHCLSHMYTMDSSRHVAHSIVDSLASY